MNSTQQGSSTRADVAIYGATGFTGRLAAHALASRGMSIVLGGRSAEKLQRLAADLPTETEVHVAAHDDAEALGRLAAGVRVMVSCAGPFGEVGELAVAAAVDAGTHYLDSTGEVDFMEQTYRLHNEAAQRQQVAVINSFAFEYVLGDCAMALALEENPGARSVRVSYSMDDMAATRGTALSAARILTSRALAGPSRGTRVPFPEPVGEQWAVTYPGGELEYVRRRRPDISAATLMAVPALVARSAGMLPALTSLISLGPVRAGIAAAVRRMPEGPTDERRARQSWMILVESDPGQGGPGVVVRGRDPYGLTGELLARGTSRLLAGEQRATGVLSPSEAFEPVEMLDSLAELGVSWERLPGA